MSDSLKYVFYQLLSQFFLKKTFSKVSISTLLLKLYKSLSLFVVPTLICFRLNTTGEVNSGISDS